MILTPPAPAVAEQFPFVPASALLFPAEPPLANAELPMPSQGQPAAPAKSAEEQIAELMKRIEALEKERQGADEKPSDKQTDASEKSKTDKSSDSAIKPDAKTDSKSDGKADAKKDGVKKDGAKDAAQGDWTDLSNEKWTVKLGGHVQMDYVMWPQTDPNIVDPAEGNYFNYRRLRLVADGTGYGVYDFRLQMTLETGQGANTNANASPDVKDAYFTVNEIPFFGRMRIGNFFVPFGLEQVTNDTNNIFLERSIPTQGIFTADREVGLAFYNCTLDQNASISTGIFFDDISDTIKTRIDSNQGYRISSRGTWLPYYDEPSDGRYLVHTGVGLLHTNDFDDRVRFRARPQVSKGPFLIDSGDVLADSDTRANLELAIVWGRFTIQNEAFLTNINLLNGTSARASGAYSHVSYFLTGENRIYERFGQHGPQFARNKPFTTSLRPLAGRAGAHGRPRLVGLIWS